jgi:hypothetical protein
LVHEAVHAQANDNGEMDAYTQQSNWNLQMVGRGQFAINDVLNDSFIGANSGHAAFISYSGSIFSQTRYTVEDTAIDDFLKTSPTYNYQEAERLGLYQYRKDLNNPVMGTNTSSYDYGRWVVEFASDCFAKK